MSMLKSMVDQLVLESQEVVADVPAVVEEPEVQEDTVTAEEVETVVDVTQSLESLVLSMRSAEGGYNARELALHDAAVEAQCKRLKLQPPLRPSLESIGVHGAQAETQLVLESLESYVAKLEVAAVNAQIAHAVENNLSLESGGFFARAKQHLAEVFSAVVTFMKKIYNWIKDKFSLAYVKAKIEKLKQLCSKAGVPPKLSPEDIVKAIHAEVKTCDLVDDAKALLEALFTDHLGSSPEQTREKIEKLEERLNDHAKALQNKRASLYQQAVNTTSEHEEQKKVFHCIRSISRAMIDFSVLLYDAKIRTKNHHQPSEGSDFNYALFAHNISDFCHKIEDLTEALRVAINHHREVADRFKEAPNSNEKVGIISSGKEVNEKLRDKIGEVNDALDRYSNNSEKAPEVETAAVFQALTERLFKTANRLEGTKSTLERALSSSIIDASANEAFYDLKEHLTETRADLFTGIGVVRKTTSRLLNLARYLDSVADVKIKLAEALIEAQMLSEMLKSAR